MDLLPGHSAHVEYRRHLQKLGESWGNTNSELDYGISEAEGSSLLGDEEPLGEIKNSCLEWCSEHNIEYVEVCASNADFDKCEYLALSYTRMFQVVVSVFNLCHPLSFN